MKTQSPKVGMSTGEAARYLGRGVKTLQGWDREDILKPKGRTPTGRRVYTREQLDAFMGLRREIPVPTRSLAYCRVSSKAQKPDLKNQRRVLEEFCAARGLVNVEWFEEIGSGLNFERKKFTTIIESIERREVRTLVVAHKDRLARFGFSWFDAMCKRHGCDLLVLNNESLSPEKEIVQDLMTIVHCFSRRLHELRNYRKKLKEALNLNRADGK